MRSPTRRRGAVLLLLIVVGALIAAACGGSQDRPVSSALGTGSDDDRLLVVTTVSPLRNIVENVGGDRVTVIGLVPEGTNSHTFEPPPSAARDIARADLIFLNGLNLELPTLELARSNAAEGVPIVLLGEAAITPEQYVFDDSFPESGGNPNPHLWTSPDLAVRYAEIVESALSQADPDGADYFALNLAAFVERVRAMDAGFVVVIATIPESNRKLLTYHDSFPFFGAKYGLAIIGAIQPSDFSEPSPREVANLVRQIRAEGVPAIFGSEVFASEVLDTIANEVGAVQVSTLRDDDLPGESGDPENTFVAMMVENVRTMAAALGGDPSPLDGFDTTNTWIPYAEFEARGA